MGLQTSTLITPADSIPVAIPAAVLNMLAIMLFLSLDIHHMLILTFQRTYDVLPIGGAVLSNPLFDDMTLRAGRLFLLGVQIAAPLIAISFLLNVVLMMLGRAVPQMNIFFESFTIRLMSGLIVFGGEHQPCLPTDCGRIEAIATKSHRGRASSVRALIEYVRFRRKDGKTDSQTHL